MNETSSAAEGNGAPRVLLVVPAYNEGKSLPDLLERLTSSYPDYDVVVVNDGSRDNTSQVVDGTRARLVSLPCNLGIGGAVQTGFCLARDEGYDVAVQVDGDGQHPADQVYLLVDAISDSGCDLVIGSRFLTGEGYQSTLSRRLGIRLFSTWLSAITGMRITDATSGFRALGRRAIVLLAGQYAEDYPEAEAILAVHRAGLRIFEVPVHMTARTAGTSSIRPLHSVGYMFKVSLAIIMSSMRKRVALP